MRLLSLHTFVSYCPQCVSRALVAAAILLLLPLCVPAAITEPWTDTPYGSGELIEKLERNSGFVIPEQEEWVKRLYALSRSHPDKKALRWRALYWDAVNKHDRKQNAEAMRLIKKAESMVDRRQYRYDYMRIRRSRIIFEMTSCRDLYRLYTAQYDDLKFFTDISDSKSMGSCHLVMSKIFIDINEPSLALRESTKARDLLRQANVPAQVASAEMNMALSYLETGDYVKGLDLLKRLERGAVAAQDRLFHVIVLLNISYSYSQMGVECPEVYIRGMEDFIRHGDNDYFMQMCSINIGSWHLRHHRYDETIRLLSSTLSDAKAHGVAEWVVKCYRGLGDCYIALGDEKKAADFYHRYAVADDSLQSSNMKVKIMRDEEAGRIKHFNDVMYEEKERARLRFMGIVTASALLLLLLGGICLWYWYKNKKATMQLMQEKMDNERKQLMLETQNRKIAANEIEMEEKRNALKSINCMVEDAKDKHEIDSDIARKIRTQVKIHTDADTGWDTFSKTFENVYPQFFSRIKANHPSLTEYDVRLCAYIVAGIDNKHIAMMLNVLPESLKKSRTRLRKKLAIASDVDLAEYLRDFNL